MDSIRRSRKLHSVLLAAALLAAASSVGGQTYNWSDAEHTAGIARTKNVWTPGDVLFAGDSLADAMKYRFEPVSETVIPRFDPVSPRTANIAITGDTILGLNDLIDRATETDSPLGAAHYANPGRIVLMIGANDILMEAAAINPYGGTTATPIAPARMQVLKDRCTALSATLAELRENTGCSVVWESILPVGFPGGFEYVNGITNDAIDELNAHIETLCAGGGFSYADLNTPFKLGEVANPAYFAADGLHVSYDGYVRWVELITDRIHSPLPANATYRSQNDSIFDGRPVGPPPFGDLTGCDARYRWGSVAVAPGTELQVTIDASGNKGISICDPLGPSWTSTTASGNTDAHAVISNTGSAALTRVLCAGHEAFGSHWKLDIDSVRVVATPNPAANVPYIDLAYAPNRHRVGSWSYGPYYSGWLKVVVPAGRKLLVTETSADVNAVGIYSTVHDHSASGNRLDIAGPSGSRQYSNNGAASVEAFILINASNPSPTGTLSIQVLAI